MSNLSKLRGEFGFLGSMVILLLVTMPPVQAQVTTNVTSSGLGTVVTPNGHVQTITGGTRPSNGPNLFHSFGAFSIGAGDTANFSNNSGLQTTNILSRVTGGQVSNIYGTIQTSGFGNANLFLLNPAGVIFGPGAIVNVGGQMNVSTADYLKFSDGSKFYVSPIQSSVLSTAPVAAFGFLGGTPTLGSQTGRITMLGGNVSTGGTLTLVGRDNASGGGSHPGVEVTGGGTLSVPSGRFNAVSAGSVVDPSNATSGGEVAVSGIGTASTTSFTGFSSLGEIQVANATVSTAGNPGGTIYFRGGKLTLSGAAGDTDLNSQTTGATNHPGTGVDIEITGPINITAGANGYAGMRSSSTSSGNAGNIHIVADTVSMNGYSTGNNSTDKSAFIQSIALSQNPLGSNPGAGKGGDITIVTNSLQMKSVGIIQTKTAGGGGAGTITITARNSASSGLVSLNGQNAYINADTSGDANAGNIIINADHLSLNRSGNQALGISSQVDTPELSTDPGSFSGNPNAGSITVTAGSLEILGGAQIATGVSRGSGHGGLLTVTADSILISGRNPNGFVSGIFSATEAPLPGSIPSNFTIAPNTGRGGDIVITSKDLQLTNFGEINAASFHAGPTGNVAITTQTLRMNTGAASQDLNPSRISINTSSTSSTADAGSLTVTASNAIDMRNGASITGASLRSLPRFPTAPVTPAGNGGAITVSTPSLSMDGAGTVISSITEGSGAGGTITVNGSTIALSNGAKISGSAAANSTGPGGTVNLTGSTLSVIGGTVETASFGNNHGGNIGVTATGDLTLGGGIVLTTQSTGPGNAGNIQLQAGNSILVRSATATTSASQASGGDITLRAPNIVRLVDSRLVSSVKGGSGSNGGNITIDPVSVVIQNSQILAQANQGAGGNIFITATGAVLVDPTSVIDASSEAGINGSVNIQAPIQNLSGAIVPLKQGLLKSALSGDRCAAMKDGHFSSFVTVGRDAVPPEPGRFLSSPALLEGIALEGHSPSRPNLLSQRLGIASLTFAQEPLFFDERGCAS